jgi:hypothetical protein
MSEFIENLSPEWREALSEVAQLREISLGKAFEMAQKVKDIFCFVHIEDGISYLLEVSRVGQRVTTSMADKGYDILKKPIM